MIWAGNLFKKRPKGFVNLYHHLSRAMWYDMSKKTLIKGEEAVALRERLKPTEYFLETQEGVRFDVWENGKPTIIYGRIFIPK